MTTIHAAVRGDVYVNPSARDWRLEHAAHAGLRADISALRAMQAAVLANGI